MSGALWGASFLYVNPAISPSPSRRQGRNREGPSEGSRSAKLEKKVKDGDIHEIMNLHWGLASSARMFPFLGFWTRVLC